MSGARWDERAKLHLKAEMVRAQIDNAKLAELLTGMGFRETRGSVAMKLSRGTFKAGWFLAALSAIGRLPSAFD